MHPPYAGLEHATAPYRHARIGTAIGDPPGLGVSADATELDVDDSAGADLERLPARLFVDDRFVETYRRRQARLKLRVIDQVTGPQRLFHHQQSELVECL